MSTKQRQNEKQYRFSLHDAKCLSFKVFGIPLEVPHELPVLRFLRRGGQDRLGDILRRVGDRLRHGVLDRTASFALRFGLVAHIGFRLECTAI